MPRIKKPKFALLDHLAEKIKNAGGVRTEGPFAGFNIGDRVEHTKNHYTGTVIGFTFSLVIVQLDEHIDFICHFWGYRGYGTYPINWRHICQG